MTFLAAPGVSVRTTEPFDFSNPQHRGLMVDVALANQEHLFNDHDNDIILILNHYEERARIGEIHAFIALQDGQQAGIFWIEIDRYGIGRPRGALLPEYRNIRNLMHFLKGLIAFGFEELGLRKLDAELTLYSKRDRASAAVEKVLKKFGFQKVGINRSAILKNGRPKDTILLDYLKDDYDGVNR